MLVFARALAVLVVLVEHTSPPSPRPPSPGLGCAISTMDRVVSDPCKDLVTSWLTYLYVVKYQSVCKANRNCTTEPSGSSNVITYMAVRFQAKSCLECETTQLHFSTPVGPTVLWP